jgi:acetolactate synthase-1/3 small subunit
MNHTISALVENKFGVLVRVAGMFSGRGFNIDTLNVGPTHDPAFSRITATVKGDDQALDQCVRQLKKLINVIDVKSYTGTSSHVGRELVMLKVAADGNTRSSIIEICDVFRAKVVDVSPSAIVIECTGNENKIRAFLELITPFGIKEMARTGKVALERGS